MRNWGGSNLIAMLSRALLATLLIPVLTVSATSADVSAGRSARDLAISRVVDLTNAERARFGLKPLRYDARLERAAQWMAEDMAIKGYFSHTDSMNRSIGQRVPTFGYENYRTLRENLAAGYRSPEEVVDGWMKSPGHRDAILCPKVEHIGIGYFTYDNSKFKVYWVQEFGAEMR